MEIAKVSALTFALISFLFVVQASAQDDCEVSIPELQGSYEGDCRKGKADGEGKAVGEHTYIGEFRKGEPHGKGKYIWDEGHYYEGEWDKGVKEGQGVLVTMVDGKKVEKKGFWEKDEYVGLYKEPYLLGDYNRGVINRIQIIKQGEAPNQINVSIRNGSASNFQAISKDGRAYVQTTFQPVAIPFEGKLEFQATPKNQSGTMPVEFDLSIFEEGNWEVIIFLTDV